MDIILASVRWKFVLFYLEDFIIFLKTIAYYLEHVDAVF